MIIIVDDSKKIKGCRGHSLIKTTDGGNMNMEQTLSVLNKIVDIKIIKQEESIMLVKEYHRDLQSSPSYDYEISQFVWKTDGNMRYMRKINDISAFRERECNEFEINQFSYAIKFAEKRGWENESSLSLCVFVRNNTEPMVVLKKCLYWICRYSYKDSIKKMSKLVNLGLTSEELFYVDNLLQSSKIINNIFSLYNPNGVWLDYVTFRNGDSQTTIRSNYLTGFKLFFPKGYKPNISDKEFMEELSSSLEKLKDHMGFTTPYDIFKRLF